MFRKRNNAAEIDDEIINIEAGMQGDLNFNTAVKLKINGVFEGNLDTKGILIIGENARIETNIIKAEDIIIAGRVKGNIVCSKQIELSASAEVIGDINAPLLIVNKGAVLKGNYRVFSTPDFE
ncbi:MAG: polymer-forming cytoskeletal protein [Candidatus Omnitrophota bacterium]